MTTSPIALDTDADPRRYEHLSRIRLEDPRAVQRAADSRRRHPGLVHGQQNFVVAADHAARGALKVRGDVESDYLFLNRYGGPIGERAIQLLVTK